MVPNLSGFTFKFLRPAPQCVACEVQDETWHVRNGGGGFRQYEIDTTENVWYRVVCKNEVGLSQGFESYLGPTGHYERMNVWSHLFAAVLYFAYLLARPLTPMGSVASLSSSLAAVSYGSFVVTFFLSSSYHVYSAQREASAITRLGDYFGIYLGIAAGTMSDICIATLNLSGVCWQAVVDVWLGMAILVLFFVVRRASLDVDETRKDYFSNKCSLGFARSTNVDLEHSSLRAAAGIAMAFSWVLAIPGAFSTLESDCAWAFAGSRFIGTGILLFGMVLDNVILYPDSWHEDENFRLNPCCYSSRDGCGGGWIMSSHALWHIIALFSTIVTSLGTEYVIAFSELLKE